MTTEGNLTSQFEELVFGFEEAWGQAPRPRIEDYLPNEEPLRTRVLEELVLIDADRRTRDGDVVTADDYLDRFPVLVSNVALQDQLNQLVAERHKRDWVLSDGTVRYRVIGFHAKGGLGQVSLAVDEELKRTVALKQIQPQFVEHPASRQRFLQEAEITGALEHPGIVPVYGLGSFSDGRPYYAMRFIQGTSLKDAIAALHASRTSKSRAERALEFRRLLSHFVAVCDAVQYAHDRGVLHRDLKPSNIMLGNYGETFVVDWGLAKAEQAAELSSHARQEREESKTSSEASETSPTLVASVATQQTQTGDKLGTPDYMSPEQAAGRLDQMGVASDVYSLGATLYHLLTGVPPLSQSRASSLEAAESERSPSEELRRQFDELVQRVLTGHFPQPRSVAPDVPRALEAICLKAMSLCPENRYGTAREFASDIERWLADEEVTALLDSWWERGGRWARRHRAFVAATVGLLSTAVLALTVGAVLLDRERSHTVEQSRKAERNEAAAITEANRANEQAQRADLEAQRAAQKATEVTQVANFLVNLFRTSDPLSLRGSGFARGSTAETDLSAYDLLQRGVQRIDDLKDQPLVQATLLENLGDIRRDLGHYELAKQLLDRAWELRQKLLEADDPAIADTALSLGRWHHDQGHFREASELYEQALSIRQKHWPDESLPVAEVEFYQAWLISDRDQQAPAAALFRKVLSTREKLLGPNHPETRIAKVFLAMNLLAEGREMEAMLNMTSDLPLAEIARGVLEYRAAELLRGQGKYDEARIQMEVLLERITTVLGKSHPLRAMLLGGVAGVARLQGKFIDARRMVEEAMAVLEPLLRNHPRMARPAAEYARGMIYGGDLSRAEQYLRHALRLALKGLEADVGLMQGETHESLTGLAGVLLAQGKYDEVATLYEQGVSYAIKFKNDQFRADCVRFHTQRLVAQGRPEPAAIYLGRMSLPDRNFPEWLALAECLHEVGKDEEAAAIEAETLRLAEQQSQVKSFLHFFLHAHLANTFQRHDQVDEAETQFRKAAEAQRLRLPAGHPHAADQAVVLAQFLRRIGKLDEAEQLLVQAERDLQTNVGIKELPTTAARLELARVQQRRGNAAQAIELARSVLADRTQLLSVGHPAVVDAQVTLAELLWPSLDASQAEASELWTLAHTATRKMFGPGHPRLFEVVERRADVLRAIGRFDQAIELLDTTLQEAPNTLPRHSSTSIALLESVRGAIAVDQQDYPAAESLLKSSHQRLQITFGRLDERTQRSLQRLIRLYEAWEKPDAAAEFRRKLLP